MGDRRTRDFAATYPSRNVDISIFKFVNTAIIVCGSPGAGKTIYGEHLSQQMGAVFLDIDIATETLVRAGMSFALRDPDDRDSPDFKAAFRQPIYDTLFDIARANLSHLPVVITGPFTKELRDPTWPEQLSTRLSAPVEVHYVYCTPELRRDRLIRRANPRDRAKLQDWDTYIRYYGDEQPPAFPHRFIDTGG